MRTLQRFKTKLILMNKPDLKNQSIHITTMYNVDPSDLVQQKRTHKRKVQDQISVNSNNEKNLRLQYDELV